VTAAANRGPITFGSWDGTADGGGNFIPGRGASRKTYDLIERGTCAGIRKITNSPKVPRVRKRSEGTIPDPLKKTRQSLGSVLGLSRFCAIRPCAPEKRCKLGTSSHSRRAFHEENLLSFFILASASATIAFAGTPKTRESGAGWQAA